MSPWASEESLTAVELMYRGNRPFGLKSVRAGKEKREVCRASMSFRPRQLSHISFLNTSILFLQLPLSLNVK